jgi:hypothetical protein
MERMCFFFFFFRPSFWLRDAKRVFHSQQQYSIFDFSLCREARIGHARMLLCACEIVTGGVMAHHLLYTCELC